MGEVTTTRRPALPLQFADGRVLPPADLDAYFLSAQRAAEAFRDPVPSSQPVRHYEEHFLLPLRRWCEARAEKVRACVVPLPNRYMKVFVVTAARRYDFPLGEELAEFELQLARAGWRIDAMLLPAAEEESLAAFYSTDGALDVFPSGAAPLAHVPPDAGREEAAPCPAPTSTV